MANIGTPNADSVRRYGVRREYLESVTKRLADEAAESDISHFSEAFSAIFGRECIAYECMTTDQLTRFRCSCYLIVMMARG